VIPTLYSMRLNLLDLNNNPDSQFSVGLVGDNIFEWDICFEGSQNSLYEVISA